jgi:uncharacterized protein (TIRG00374 family)
MAAIQFNRKSLLKLFGPLLFIFLLIRVVDPKQAAGYLKEIRIDMIFISIALFPIIMYAKTLRWQTICRHLNLHLPIGKLFQINYISWFMGNLPPGGLALLSKIIYLKDDGKPVSTSFISISLEKLLDIVGLMIFGIYALIYFPKGLVEEEKLWIVIAIIGAASFLIFAFKDKLRESCQKWLNKKLLTKVKFNSDGFEEALNLFWSGFQIKLFVIVIVLTIFIYLLMSLALYILAMALGIKLSFGLTVACLALIGIANIVPVTVNGLGTRDAILLFALPLAGYSKEAAIALAFTAFLWSAAFKFSGVIFWLKNPLPTKAILSFKNKLFKER